MHHRRRVVRRDPCARAALAERLEARQLLDAITWDGGGDNETWGDPLNWSGDLVPVAGDTVTIDTVAGSGEITLAGDFVVDSFASDRPLRLNSGSLTFSAPSVAGAPLTVAGGTLAGAGNLTVNASLVWLSGSMTGEGVVVIPADVEFLIDGGGVFSKPVQNSGTTTWASGAVEHNAAFTNLPGSLFRVQADSAWAGAGTLNNAGTVNKSGPGVASISSAFSNIGSIAVLSGTLTLAGDGGNAGLLKVFPGTTLQLQGDVDHADGATYSGAGLIRAIGGTHTFLAAATIASRFEFISGAVDGAELLTFTSAVTWIGGAFTGTGNVVFAAASALTLTGSFTKVLQREMFWNGTVQWVQGLLSLTNARLVIGGTLNITGNAVLLGASGTNSLAHHGTLVKTSASITTINVPVEGTGVWSVQAGTLTLSGGGSGSGNRIVAEGATLRFTNSYAHNGGAILGAGLVLLDGGTHTIGTDMNATPVIELNQGLLTGPGDLFIGNRMEWSGGSMAGGGFTVIRPGAEMEIAEAFLARELRRRIVNNGDLNWAAGNVRLHGGSIVNAAGRTFTISGDGALTAVGTGGVVINFGTIVKGGDGSVAFAASTTGGGGARLSNKGTVRVNAGTLTLAGGVLQVIGAALVEGAWIVTGPAVLDLVGASLTSIGPLASVTLSGASASFEALDTLGANRGVLTLENGAQVAVAPVSGVFVNAGTLHLDRGTQLLVSGSFRQTSAGHLAVHIAGTGAANFGRINAIGAATLGGSLAIEYVGFTPASGQSFQFLLSVSRVGQFAPVTLPPSPAATVAYLPTGARLMIT